ncbi:MAG: glycosyltransferase family 4 protein [Dehalococcoidia bacterium]|nr:glycosyltransferase family 4 protein [Dehalococcoidia bacterium]
MKRICIIRQNYFPAEAHVRKNVDALTAAGYAVDVVCLREKGERAREPYGEGMVHRLPLTRRRGGPLRYAFEYAAFMAMASLLVSRLALRRRYRIVEVYNLPDFFVLAALVPRLLGARVILYLFEMMPEHIADQFGLRPGGMPVKALRLLERWSVAFANRAIVVGPYDKGVRERRGVPAAKLALVMNVPEEGLFRPAPPPEPEGGDAFRVITHGSLLKRYGIQTLIRAVPHLRDHVPGLEVWIVGAGEYREELEALAKELGVETQVRFTGWAPIEEVPALIARCHVGVVPMLATWMLPNKLFEYAAMERPIVASAVPSIQALFPGDSVLYFPPGDAEALARCLAGLYADPALRARLAANARRVLERHSWQEMREVYIRAHDDLLSAPAGRHAVAGSERSGDTPP